MFKKNLYLHALNLLHGFGPKMYEIILPHFDFDPERAWKNKTEWQQWIPKERCELFFSQEKNIDLYKEEALLASNDIQLISVRDDHYPPWLKEIHHPPFLLYLKGQLPKKQLPLLTIVGSRRNSSYGKAVLNAWIPEFVSAGIGIISGLAFGIDAISHETTLQAGGYTAAFLGSGLCHITPSQHQSLAERLLASGGGLLSEFPPRQEPLKGFFPRRNRLLAGMSPMTFIVEAAERSGALITARYALESNREVGALPGSVFSITSQGCHSLLKQGAHVLTSAADLLEIYGLQAAQQQKAPIDLKPEEQELLRHLQTSGIQLDDLAQKAHLPTSTILSQLSVLELKGLVAKDPAKGYFLKTLIK